MTKNEDIVKILGIITGLTETKIAAKEEKKKKK